MPNTNYTPDSVLEATRKTANIVNLPWSDVQPIYRALQEEKGPWGAWLPKSQGRTIWVSHPNFVSRVLFALGSLADAKSAHDIVSEIATYTADGKAGTAEIPAMETAFLHLLTNPQKADSVECVEFHTDTKAAVIRYKNGHEEWFARPERPSLDDTRGIRKRGVISGTTFRLLSREIAWGEGCPVDIRLSSKSEDE